jgi:hypothetical protein
VFGAEVLQAINLKRHYSMQQVEYCRNLFSFQTRPGFTLGTIQF